MALQHLVDQAFFALEVVIELALPGGRSLDDFVRAGGANSLLVEQIGGHLENAEPCVCASRVLRFHGTSSNLYLQVHSLNLARNKSAPSIFFDLYLIFVKHFSTNTERCGIE